MARTGGADAARLLQRSSFTDLVSFQLGLVPFYLPCPTLGGRSCAIQSHPHGPQTRAAQGSPTMCRKTCRQPQRGSSACPGCSSAWQRVWPLRSKECRTRVQPTLERPPADSAAQNSNIQQNTPPIPRWMHSPHHAATTQLNC